jgi:hypothetical protein
MIRVRVRVRVKIKVIMRENETLKRDARIK